jgi:hypothetical protein
MASSRLNPEEAQFISSLRAMLAKGGTLPTRLVSGGEPIAIPKTVVTTKSSVVEPLSGYWTGVNTASFSRSRLGLYPSDPGTELVIEANKLPGPPRGRGLTLTRSNESYTGSLGNMNVGIYADVEFGIGGNVQKIRCDWNNCILNLPASVMRVSATWYAPDTSIAYYTDVMSGSLGVSVSVDPLVNKSLNTYTQFVDFSTALVIDIPPFAVGFWIPIDPAAVFGPSDVVYVYAVPGNQVSNTVTNSALLGLLSSSAIQVNGLTNMTSLPVTARSLNVQDAFSGIGGSASKIIWALGV